MSPSKGTDSMRMWGTLLRSYRLAAGVTQGELAALANYTQPVVAYVEAGERMPSPWLIATADKLVNADGRLLETAEHLSRELPAIGPDDTVEEERRALTLWAYDPLVLHPLLRTEAYTRALLRTRRPPLSNARIHAEVDAERERQARMAADATGVYSFVIEEWVLRRPTGGPATMRAQLAHLADLSELPHVTVQVIPTACGTHAGLTGTTTTLLETPEHAWIAHLPLHHTHHLIHDPTHISALHARHTQLRAQALPQADTAALLRQLADELPAG